MAAVYTLFALCGATACNECEQIESDYKHLIGSSRSCESDTDCIIINQPCPLTTGGCCAAVNTSFNHDKLSSLKKEYSDKWCDSAVCGCPGCEGDAGCTDQVCEYRSLEGVGE